LTKLFTITSHFIL